MTKLVYGIGINDADYVTQPTVNSSRLICHFYETWRQMIRRCYSKRFQEKFPSYAGCSVAESWHLFSNFKSWMETQDYQGKELDKDILHAGSRTYSEETCVFVSQDTNKFTIDRPSARGDWPLGVCWHKNRKMFIANCRNPFSKRLEHLGYFDSPDDAHEAWRGRKHEIACRLAELQKDERVAAALRIRYATTVHLIDTE